MQLVIRRDQRAALIGSKPVFVLDVRAQLTPDEAANVKKYKLDGTVLYASHSVEGGSGVIGLASRIAYKAITLTVTVDSLMRGQRVECKDVLELLGAEQQIRIAAETFASVLAASTHFGGEEVLELQAG